MSGKILIVDPIATNRIVLKVKLSGACYQVAQAASGAEGLRAVRQTEPDLILCAAHLPDMAADGFARALRALPGPRSIPLLVETAGQNATFRFGILAAGADDILLKPYEDTLLLAKLRSLLRLRASTEDLTLREGASRALGMAEPPREFSRPGRIALIADTPEAAVKWQGGLAPHLAARPAAFALKEAMRRIEDGPPPEAVALRLTAQTAERGMQLLADLRAKPETRDAGVLVLIEGAAPQRLAADALDRGASDVIQGRAGAQEIALRLRRQIARKHTLDRLRADMRDGLRAALTDPLTGLFNRRHALPHLARIAETAARSGGDFAVMVIDVDHFKLVNDRFGHSAGDAVLAQLADVLRNAVGEQNLLARIGGEEFLVVLPDSQSKEAKRSAKRLCAMVRNTAFRLPGRSRPLQVTVSIGVALLSDVRAPGPAQDALAPAPPAGAQPPLPLHETVLERADKALYGAKAHGRNQVTLSNARSAA